jgi:hypothetical protein
VDKATPDDAGNFEVSSNGVHLSARIVCLQGAQFTIQRREHAYQVPFNKGRLGDVFEDRHESYIEACLTDQICTLLSLFAVFPPDQIPVPWQVTRTGWAINLGKASYIVHVASDDLLVLEAN